MFRTIADGVPGTEMSGHWLEEDEIWKILSFVRVLERSAAGSPVGCEAGPGDAARGKTLFSGKGGCAGCHTRVARLGPDLSVAGATHTRAYLRESIVNPNQEVAAQYRATRVRTKAGESLRGLLLNQDEYSVHLMDQRERIRSFARSELAEFAVLNESLMPSFGKALTPGETDDLVAYLCTLRTAPPATNVSSTGTPDLLRPDPRDWVTYSGNYASHRHSGLKQITPANTSRLQLKWMWQAKIAEKFETTPLVIDGTMYVTVPPSDVYALDASTGVKLWEYRRRIPPKSQVCCGQVNRGVAVLGDRLFLATVDAHAVALDRKTGRVLWDTEMIDYRAGYSATHAPLVVKAFQHSGIRSLEFT